MVVLENKRAFLENKEAIPGNKRAPLENKRAMPGIKKHFWEVKGCIELRTSALDNCLMHKINSK